MWWWEICWVINTQEPCAAGQQILKGGMEEGKEGGFLDRGTVETVAVQGSSLTQEHCHPTAGEISQHRMC